MAEGKKPGMKMRNLRYLTRVVVWYGVVDCNCSKLTRDGDRDRDTASQARLPVTESLGQIRLACHQNDHLIKELSIRHIARNQGLRFLFRTASYASDHCDERLGRVCSHESNS